MALTWGDLNGKVQDKIIPTVSDLIYKSLGRTSLGLTAWKHVARKSSLIKLNPEMGTDCKQATSRAAVETEREDAPRGDATVRSHANSKHERLAEMTSPLCKQRNKMAPIFIRIRTNNGQQFDGGVKIRQNVGYAELNGGPFGRGQTFNTDYVPTDTAFEVNPKFYYTNITLYGTDDVLARGPQQAVPFVGSKIANAAGKMAKLIATDMYLDGLGTGSSTLSIDGFNQWFDNGNLFSTVGNLTRTDLGVSNGKVVAV